MHGSFGKEGYDEVFLYLLESKYGSAEDSRKRAIPPKAGGFVLDDGVLLTKAKGSNQQRRWVRDPGKFRFSNHVTGMEGGHFGRDKTRAKISARYYWEGLGEDVAFFFQAWRRERILELLL